MNQIDYISEELVDQRRNIKRALNKYNELVSTPNITAQMYNHHKFYDFLKTQNTKHPPLPPQQHVISDRMITGDDMKNTL